MNLLSDFLGLRYCRTIRDCWPLTAGSTIVLMAAVGLPRKDTVPVSAFTNHVDAALMGVATAFIYFDARASYKQSRHRSCPDGHRGANP